jgi:hypothetical protein
MPRSGVAVDVAFGALSLRNTRTRYGPTDNPQEMPVENNSLPQSVERVKSLSAHRSPPRILLVEVVRHANSNWW